MAHRLASLLFVASCGLATASECGALSGRSQLVSLLEEPALGSAGQEQEDDATAAAGVGHGGAAPAREKEEPQSGVVTLAGIADCVSLIQDFFLFGLAFVAFCAWKCVTEYQERKARLPLKSATVAEDPPELVGEAGAARRPGDAPLQVDALVQAMYSDNIDDLRRLLGERSVNACDEVCCCTALHMAAHCNCLPAAEALLARGADVNVRDAWDETPLHFASRAGHVGVCALLLRRGADANAGNAEGCTPLLAAAEAKQAAVCEWLLDNGAHTGGMDEEDLPPLLTNMIHRRILEAVAPPGGAM